MITEALVATHDVPTLWSEHGIIADVVVRAGLPILWLLLNFTVLAVH